MHELIRTRNLRHYSDPWIHFLSQTPHCLCAKHWVNPSHRLPCLFINTTNSIKLNLAGSILVINNLKYQKVNILKVPQVSKTLIFGFRFVDWYGSFCWCVYFFNYITLFSQQIFTEYLLHAKHFIFYFLKIHFCILF